MKRFLFLVTFACVAMFAACEYDDSALVDRMDGFESRLERLEELCAQMNTNISSLQTIVNALQQKDFITTVAPINKDGKEVGYSITFSSGKSITIYHGNDGKDGEDGTDGKTPQIGVKQDTDGVYYWTVDGEWLTDADGAKIQAAAEDGADGEDGKDGTTPQLKIEDDYWYVSYDNGATWSKLGKATGEDGSDGSDGTSGDNIFQSVTQDSNNVYFKLADGTTIIIPKSASAENIVLTYIPRYSDGKATVFYTEKSDSYVELDFEVSPASAAANWRNIATVKAVYTETRAGVEFVDMAILDWSTDTAKGTITVKASGKNLSDAFFAGTQDASARLVVNGDGVNIISDYVPMVAVKSGSTPTTQPNNEIWYTSTDGKIVTPYDSNVFGANIVSNTYEDGKGVIKFDGEVTSIGRYAFSGRFANDVGKRLLSIKIPNSVKEIEYEAFSYSRLEDIELGAGVTKIESWAFSDCGYLTSLTIPNSVEEIGNSIYHKVNGRASMAAFYGKFASDDNRCLIINGVLNSFAPCGLTSYTIPNSVTKIGDYAFTNCSSLTSVTIPNSVTSIGRDAFRETGLTSVTIPDSVTEIAYMAFEGCRSLTSVTIPERVTSIGDQAFTNCSSMTAFYGKFASEDHRCLIVDGVLNAFAPAGLTSYTIPNSVTTIGKSIFIDCSSLTTITIPDSVTTIKDNPFNMCSGLTAFYGKYASEDNRCLIVDGVLSSFAHAGLTSYSISDGVAKIGCLAFSQCYGLTNVTIPDSVTTIGGYAFDWCRSLTSVTIPDSVTEIGEWAFNYCESLTSVYCKPTTPPTRGWNMFNYNASGRKIYVPIGSGAAYKAADGWKEYADAIEEKAM